VKRNAVYKIKIILYNISIFCFGFFFHPDRVVYLHILAYISAFFLSKGPFILVEWCLLWVTQGDWVAHLESQTGHHQTGFPFVLVKT